QTGVDVFDSTIERTTSWLLDLMRELNWSDRRRSYMALRSVLHGLRDHLPIEKAIRFGNQLPMLIRGLYFEEWDIRGKPLPWTSQKDLPDGNSSSFTPEELPDGEADMIVRAVFRLLDRKVVAGEMEDFHNLLPGAVHDFPEPPTGRAA